MNKMRSKGLQQRWVWFEVDIILPLMVNIDFRNMPPNALYFRNWQPNETEEEIPCDSCLGGTGLKQRPVGSSVKVAPWDPGILRTG